MADIVVKRCDTLPHVNATLYWQDGSNIDLTGATVRFQMHRRNSAALIVDSPSDVSDPSSGSVVYRWTTQDTSVAGSFIASFRVTFGSGDVLTVPNNKYISVDVIET